MNKVVLPDGRWFDTDSAKVFEAAYFYHPNGDPNHPICLATGNEFSSETLYLTEKGTLILRRDEHPSGLSEYAEISLEGATRWLIANGHGHQHTLTQLELQSETAALRC